MGRLLIDEYPLMVLPTLAKLVGVNQALFIQQLHFLTNNKEINNDFSTYKDGYMWVYNSVDKWHQQYFYFWSKRTLERVIEKCEKNKYIISTDRYNQHGYDNTKWYRLNPDKIAELVEIGDKQFKERQKKLKDKARNIKPRQNDGTTPPDCRSGTDKMAEENRQNDVLENDNMAETRPETTTKTSTDINNKNNNINIRQPEFSKKLSSIKPDLQNLFVLCFGKKPVPVQVKLLDEYDMADELIGAVMLWAGRGGHNPSFFFEALDRLVEQGITTAEEFMRLIATNKDDKRLLDTWNGVSFNFNDLPDTTKEGEKKSKEKKSKKPTDPEKIKDIESIFKDKIETNIEEIHTAMMNIIYSNVLKDESHTVWFEDIKPSAVVNGEFILTVPNKLIKEWHELRYIPVMEDILYSLTDKKLRVKFIVTKAQR